MKISLNAIKFINEHFHSAGDPAPEGAKKLIEKIGAQLGAVEHTVDFGARFEGVLIVKVVSVADHPNADRLHVCMIDDGQKAQNVTRNDQGLVQVVCGAPNVRAGMCATWLPPGATVPSTYGKDPFVLEARELRGVVSNGMLASPKELSLGENHEGILEITFDRGDQEVAPGTPFADANHLRGDKIVDIENKMFTHRPDCFGLLGVARELEGIQHRPYKSPDWYTPSPEFPAVEAAELKLEVQNELPELVPRFSAITLRDVQVGPSPIWLQVDLARLGLRSINNIVDYTNWYMLLSSQPLHAYDYDKVLAQDAGADHVTIVLRHPHEGEKIHLLSGKEIEPRAEAIMIATRDKLIGVGGVMGGANTEVDETTKNIILECANFDMYSIRRTSMAHGLFTDAVSRFNKGQSPLQNLAVLHKITDEIRANAAGKIASPLIDVNHVAPEIIERASLHAPVTLTSSFVNARLGFDLSPQDVATLLTNVEFKVAIDGETLTITAPFWRTDIEIPEDIVEEIGRLYGYDHLPLVLPHRDLTPAAKNRSLELKQQIRTELAKTGANEVLTYSFVHGRLLAKVGQDKSQAFQLSNALSPELQYYRLSITPSLLEKIHANIKAGTSEFALFELGKAHVLSKVDADSLPEEFERLAFVFAADAKSAYAASGAPFYAAKKYLLSVLHALGVDDAVRFEPLDPAEQDSALAYYEPNRAATVYLGEHKIGRIGEYTAAVRAAFKLPQCVAGFELGLKPLFTQTRRKQYLPLPKFPKIEQDLCLRVAVNMVYQTVHNFVQQTLDDIRPKNTLCKLAPVDIYQREDDAQHKQITLRASLASYNRTLTDQEVTQLLDQVAAAAHEKLSAEKI